MFDISFSELALCFLVALVVLGPERLPKVARTVGRWTGHMRSYMRNLTSELERETEVVELKRQFNEARQALRESASAFEESGRRIASDVQDSIKPPPESLPAVDAPATPPAVEPPAPTDSSRPV